MNVEPSPPEGVSPLKKKIASRSRTATVLVAVTAIMATALFHMAAWAGRSPAGQAAKATPVVVFTQPVSGLNDPRIVSVVIILAILSAGAALGNGVSAWLLRRRIIAQHEELRTTNALLQSMGANQDAVLRALPDLVFIYDAEARYTGYMTSDEHRLAVPPGQFLGRNNLEIFGNEDYHRKTLAAIGKALADEGVQVFEYELPSLMPDHLFEARIVRLENDKALSIIRDITERRGIELMKDASIREKEALLKEIHHRVKNNMQIVSSLLSMQSAKARDDYDRELFIESQGRIRAMSAVHDHLYRSSDFTSIPAAEYLADLVTGLEASWSRPDRIVRASVEADDTAIELERAVPIGLIVNELATNSFKYAFESGNSGTIAVSLHRLDDGAISLAVSDDGDGFPAGFDIARGDGGMGYTIINALVGQIGGSMRLSVPDGGGSNVTILIPPAPARSAVAVEPR